MIFLERLLMKYLVMGFVMLSFAGSVQASDGKESKKVAKNQKSSLAQHAQDSREKFTQLRDIANSTRNADYYPGEMVQSFVYRTDFDIHILFKALMKLQAQNKNLRQRLKKLEKQQR